MTHKLIRLTLTTNVSSIRLDKYLAEEIEFLSRTKVKEYIKTSKVLINGKPVKPSYLLEGGEIVEIEIPDIAPSEVKGEDIPLDVLYEDEILIVVNKPAGMVTHQGAGNYSGTLVNGLVYHFSSLSQVYGEQRPGIVHRLDKDTSGILVVAKTDECHRHLADQFSNRTVSKTYVGIVWGKLKEKKGVIDNSIIRHPTKRKQFKVGEGGRSAITEYRVMKEWEYLSLLEILPKTGRTHQIRVHLASINHPIFGDETYGGGKSRIKGYQPEVRNQIVDLFNIARRFMLHARTLSFYHPKSGVEVTFSAPIPEDLQRIIDRLDRTRV